MELRIFTEPQQGASYDQLLTVAQSAERLGFDAFFRSDHYLKMGDVSGLPGPTDAWVTLAGLARDTSTIRLGTLMTSATFRLPGPLAIAVAQVDRMSGGRVELGIGAGWYDTEHTAYGIPFPSLGERFDRLAEQLAVISGLWSTAEGETFEFPGEHYKIVASPALPKPVQSDRRSGGPPLLIGGFGSRRTPRLAARYAAEFNVPFAPLADVGPLYDKVRAACEEIDRDPATLTWSAALVVCCGADESEVSRRATSIGRDPSELRTNGLAGTPAEVLDRLGAFAEAGVGRVYLQVLDLDDLDHLELLGAEVLGGVAGLRP